MKTIKHIFFCTIIFSSVPLSHAWTWSCTANFGSGAWSKLQNDKCLNEDNLIGNPNFRAAFIKTHCPEDLLLQEKDPNKKKKCERAIQIEVASGGEKGRMSKISGGTGAVANAVAKIAPDGWDYQCTAADGRKEWSQLKGTSCITLEKFKGNPNFDREFTKKHCNASIQDPDLVKACEMAQSVEGSNLLSSVTTAGIDLAKETPVVGAFVDTGLDYVNKAVDYVDDKINEDQSPQGQPVQTIIPAVTPTVNPQDQPAPAVITQEQTLTQGQILNKVENQTAEVEKATDKLLEANQERKVVEQITELTKENDKMEKEIETIKQAAIEKDHEFKNQLEVLKNAMAEIVKGKIQSDVSAAIPSGAEAPTTTPAAA